MRRERPKAVHVSIVHPAGDVRIFVKECRSLAAAGYDVTLYARTEEAYERDGIRVRPVPTSRSRLGRMTVGVWSLLRPLLRECADIYHLHDPELVPLGLALRARGYPVVFDAHEPFALQVYDKGYLPAALRPTVSAAAVALQYLTGRGLSAVVAASPVAAEAYAGARRLATVNNFPVTAEGTDIVPYSRRSRALVYVGGLSRARGWHAMLDAACRIHAQTGGRLTLVGPFQQPELEDDLARPEVAKAVEYLGVLDPFEARRVMADSCVGLVLFQRSRAHERAWPNKLFEYMAAGVPIVASNFTHWQEILASRGSGIVVRPDDPDAVANACLEILANPSRGADMSTNGRSAATDHYVWDNEARTLLSLYAELLRG